MKKIKNILFSLVTFVFLFMIINNVNAAQDFTTADHFPTCSSGGYTNSVGSTPNDYFCVLFDSSGNQVYCLEITKHISGGTSHTYLKTVTGSGQACGVLDAMNEGIIPKPTSNGTSFVSNLSEENYYKLQKKIWDYEGKTDLCKKEESTNLTAGSFGISNKNLNMTRETINGADFYVATISVNHSNLINNTYNITKSTNDLIISNEKGGNNVTTSSAKTLYVRVPVSKVSSTTVNYAVSFKSTYNSKTVVTISPFVDFYKHSDDRQLLGKIGLNRSSSTLTENLSDSVNLSLNIAPSLTLKKVDTSGNLIPGSKMSVTYNGSLLGEYTLTNGTHVLNNNLKFGEYCVTEVTAPDGYVVVNKKQCVTLTSENPSATISIENSKTVVKFKKVWYDKKNKEYKEISGATFKILDEAGNTVKNDNGEDITWTTDGKVYAVEGLKAGKYTLVEVNPPSGYGKVKEIPFTIKEDGSIESESLESTLAIMDKDELTIIIVNELNVTTFSKQDATTGKELPGATLQILDKDKKPILDAEGNVLYKWISTDKEYVIEGLPAGKYYLKEIIQPDGYILNEELVEFEVKDDGSVTRVVMKNSLVEVPDTASSISKGFIIGGSILLIAGVSIVIYTFIKRKKANLI